MAVNYGYGVHDGRLHRDAAERLRLSRADQDEALADLPLYEQIQGKSANAQGRNEFDAANATNPWTTGFEQLAQNAEANGTDRWGFGRSRGEPDRGIADDPDSTFNTQTGPFGRFGAGTGGAMTSLLSPEQQAMQQNPSDARLAQLRSRSSLRHERPAMNSLRGR